MEAVEANSLIATMTAMWQASDSKAFSLAKSQAQKSFEEGGLPIGSALVDGNGEVIGVGHNQRIRQRTLRFHVCETLGCAATTKIAPSSQHSRHAQCVLVPYCFSRFHA